MTKLWIASVLFGVACVGHAGCTALTDAGRFERAEDLRVSLSNMGAYVGTRIEAQLVSGQTGEVEARAVIDSLRSPTMDLRMFSALVPGRNYSIQVYADENGDAWQTAGEPTWETQVMGGSAEIDGTQPSTVDMPLVSGGPFTYELADMTPHVGQRFELQVFDEDLGRAVGYYRTDAAEISFTVQIVAIIHAEHTYLVEFYADHQNPEGYSFPGDHCWRETYTAEGDELTASFTHRTPFDELETFESVDP